MMASHDKPPNPVVLQRTQPHPLCRSDPPPPKSRGPVAPPPHNTHVEGLLGTDGGGKKRLRKGALRRHLCLPEADDHVSRRGHPAAQPDPFPPPQGEGVGQMQTNAPVKSTRERRRVRGVSESLFPPHPAPTDPPSQSNPTWRQERKP